MKYREATTGDAEAIADLHADSWRRHYRGAYRDSLGALAEFAGERVRKSQNLEKAYLHGRFGALPDVDRTEMLRALGLIG